MCAIMHVDKFIGLRLADKSAVGCDKSAPTVWPEYFVHLHNRHSTVAKKYGTREREMPSGSQRLSLSLLACWCRPCLYVRLLLAH